MITKATFSTCVAFLAAQMVLSGALHPASAASSGSSQDIREITSIEKELASETDIDRVMPHYAEDAILIDIASPGWYEGRQQIYAAVQPQLAVLQSIKYSMDEISIASDGHFACAAMQIHFDATKKDNTSLKLSIRQVDAFQKIGGNWRIIQQHVSVPVEQKSSTPIYDATLSSRGPLPFSQEMAPGPSAPVPQAKKEILKWLMASETPKSIDEMAEYYGPGEDFLIFDWWSPREVRGHKELLDYYAPQFKGVRDMDIKVPVIKVASDGMLGAQVSQQHLSINMTDGTHQLISFRQSDCVHRVGKTWYSFFEMGSFPVDNKTGKAIMVNPAAFSEK
jgi:ketosteroid isomerase-like protein